MSCLAIIDVETTGLNPHRRDRIVEIAAIVMRPDGEILREFVSLINPERDIGPTRIHGISARDALSAPRFKEVAGALLEVLDGCVVLVGHNIHFDHAFLMAEFARLGNTFPKGPTLCTLHMAGGGTLSSCCAAHQIQFTGQAHSALHDARATAQLLAILLSNIPSKVQDLSMLSPIVWPSVPKSSVCSVTRNDSLQRQPETPTYLQKLLAQVRNTAPRNSDDSFTLGYAALLDQVLEDRRVDEIDGESLCEIAAQCGIDGHQVCGLHRDYLHHLAVAALADGIVSDTERRDLFLVADLLGIEHSYLHGILESTDVSLSAFSASRRPSNELLGHEKLAGKIVCFTGEFQCQYLGTLISRKTAMELAVRYGINVVESVTKKLDLLVVADPHTQSGKARKARQYGVRLMHELVFWNILGVKVD